MRKLIFAAAAATALMTTGAAVTVYYFAHIIRNADSFIGWEYGKTHHH